MKKYLLLCVFFVMFCTGCARHYFYNQIGDLVTKDNRPICGSVPKTPGREIVLNEWFNSPKTVTVVSHDGMSSLLVQNKDRTWARVLSVADSVTIGGVDRIDPYHLSVAVGDRIVKYRYYTLGSTRRQWQKDE